MDTKEKLKTLKRSNRRHKKLVITLATALGITGVTAIVAPTMVAVLKKGSGDMPANVSTITFDAGSQGTIEDENYRYILTGAKYSTISSPTVTAKAGYVFAGWLKPDNTVIKGTDVVNGNMTLTAKYIKEEVKVYLTLDISDFKYHGVTCDKEFVSIGYGKTWEEIKATMPQPSTYDPVTNYVFQYWYIDDGSETPKEIDPKHQFVKDETLKPYYLDKSVQRESVTMTFKIITDQFHNQWFDEQSVASNPPEVTVTYCGTSGYEEKHTFSELGKPTVCETGKDSFSGWYKTYDAEKGTFSDPWSEKEVLDGTYTTIYAKCVEIIDNPIITFADPDDAGDYSWIGNQTIMCTQKPVVISDLTMPYVYKQLNPTDFSTPFYFSGWKAKNAAGVLEDLPTSTSTSITICPTFTNKPNIQFWLDESGESVYPTSSETKFYIDPSGVWGNVAAPTALQSKQGESFYFIGWTTTKTMWDKEKQQEVEYQMDLTPTTPLDEVNTTKPIKPYYTNACNKIEFVTDGVLTDRQTIQTVSYEGKGNAKVGTNRSANVYFTSSVNKPVPYAVDEHGTELDTFSFTGIWQYYDENEQSPTYHQWVDINDEFYIASQEEGHETTTQIRPVLEKKFQISFDANGGTIKEETWGKIESIQTTSLVEFGDMYKPTVIPQESGLQFLYWATRQGTEGSYVYTPVKKTDKFTEPTTLYAVYDQTQISTTVNFALNPEDLDPEKVKLYPVKISGTKVVDNHDPDKTITFGSIAHAQVSKEAHVLAAWQVRTGEGTTESPYKYTDIDDDYVLPNGGSGITVYARFTPDTSFKLITVKKPTSGEYEIDENNNRLYAKGTEKFPVNTSDGTIGISVKKIGYEIVGWKAKGAGEDDWIWHKTKQTTPRPLSDFESLEEIEPEFEVATRTVTFAKGRADSISGDWTADPVEADYQTNLQEFIDSKHYVPHRDQCEFVGWDIYVDDTTQYEVTSSMTITENIVITPRFVGESEFKEGDKPYFYDEEVGKWAQIYECYSGSYMLIYYAGGEIAYSDPRTFDHEIFFGRRLTSIPDNFLKGCINFNNGGQKLVLPTDLVRGEKAIGDNFMEGCTSFNQEIDFTLTDDFGGEFSIIIGDNFMRNCWSFNSNINIKYKYTGTEEQQYKHFLKFGNGFMFDCKSFTKVLDLSGWSSITTDSGAVESDFYYCLSTFDKYAQCYDAKDPKITVVSDSSVLRDQLSKLIFTTCDGTDLKPYRNVLIKEKI